MNFREDIPEPVVVFTLDIKYKDLEEVAVARDDLN